jgi:PEP-CTERM motif
MQLSSRFVQSCAPMRVAVCVAGFLALSSQAFGNAGNLLPLTQYQTGTEQTNSALVTNPGFEQPGTINPNPNPTGWTLQGKFQAGTPLALPGNAPANYFGGYAAQGPLQNQATEPNGYVQSVTLAPNTDYVLSGYLWCFSQNYDETVLELVDPGDATRTKTISLSFADVDPNNPSNTIDGTKGVFGYVSFNSSFFNASSDVALLKARFDFDESAGAHNIPDIAGQIDNIAITPAAQFVPPQAVPEPASLALAGIVAVLGIRRRRA